MNSLKDRWFKEQNFIDLLQFVREHSKDSKDLGITPEIYNKLPKSATPKLNEVGVDLRYIDLSLTFFGKVWMGHILSDAIFSESTFVKTYFDYDFAYNTNFVNCKFDHVQMCLFYAHGANLEGCTFETCVAFGGGADRNRYGDYNDFRECNFTNVKAHKTGFSRSDFTGVNFTNAQFIDCDINNAVFVNAVFKHAVFRDCTFIGGDPAIIKCTNQCDFRGCDLTGVQFIGCDFAYAIFDDTPAARQAVSSGNNTNIETIEWVV